MSDEHTTYHVEIFTASALRYQGHVYTVDLRANTIGLTRVRCYGTENRGNLIQLAPQGLFYNFIQFRIPDVKEVWLINEEGGKTSIDIQKLLQDEKLQKQRKSQTDILPEGTAGKISKIEEEADEGDKSTSKGIRPVTWKPLTGDSGATASESIGAMAKRMPLGDTNFADRSQLQNLKTVNKFRATDNGRYGRYNPNPYNKYESKELSGTDTTDNGGNIRFSNPRFQNGNRWDTRNDYYKTNSSRPEGRNENNGSQNSASKMFASSFTKQNNDCGSNHLVAYNLRMQKDSSKTNDFATKNHNGAVPKDPKSKSTMQFAHDYNFERTNSAFEKIRTQLAKIDILNTSAAEDSAPPTDDISQETNDSKSSLKVGYKKKQSFFDNLTPTLKAAPNTWHDLTKVNEETFGVLNSKTMLSESNSQMGRYKIDYSADFGVFGTNRPAIGTHIRRDHSRIYSDKPEDNGCRVDGRPRPNFSRGNFNSRYSDTSSNSGNNGGNFNSGYNGAKANSQSNGCNTNFGPNTKLGYNSGSKSVYNDGNSNFQHNSKNLNFGNMCQERGNARFERDRNKNSYGSHQYAGNGNGHYERGSFNAGRDAHGSGCENNGAGGETHGTGHRSYRAEGAIRAVGRDNQGAGRDTHGAARKTYGSERFRTDYENGSSYSTRGSGLDARGHTTNRIRAEFNNPEIKTFADVIRGQRD